jgi:hypothetical protein
VLKKGSIGLILLLCLAGGALADRPLAFGEFWNNVAYYDTNLEYPNFASVLAYYQGKVGLNLFNSPLQAYAVYYGEASQSANYWDNSLYYGGGLRFKPFEGYNGTGWYNEWVRDVKIFGESLSSTYLKNAASAEAGGLRKTDFRYGFDLWHEWNLDWPIPSLPWGELWANYSHRSTNFGWEDFNDYIFYFQPKFGWHLGNGIESYLKADLVASGKSGASYAFLNTADYGVGIRVEPWRQEKGIDDFIRKFKIFAEVLGVSYLKDKSATPVNSDLRFGIDFSTGR